MFRRRPPRCATSRIANYRCPAFKFKQSHADRVTGRNNFAICQKLISMPIASRMTRGARRPARPAGSISSRNVTPGPGDSRGTGQSPRVSRIFQTARRTNRRAAARRHDWPVLKRTRHGSVHSCVEEHFPASSVYIAYRAYRAYAHRGSLLVVLSCETSTNCESASGRESWSRETIFLERGLEALPGVSTLSLSP